MKIHPKLAGGIFGLSYLAFGDSVKFSSQFGI